ncbi:MAG: hypothetical protein ACFCU8_08375 [Thermosynechococcaceae cyanobacterium]
MDKTQAINRAHDKGWTKEDAKRSFEEIKFPAGEELVVDALLRFAGPELKRRQYLQGAQKGQATKNKNLLNKLETKHQQMIDDYEGQLSSDRSNFVGAIRVVYAAAKRFGYQDAWIESLLATYDDYDSNQKTSQEVA